MTMMCVGRDVYDNQLLAQKAHSILNQFIAECILSDTCNYMYIVNRSVNKQNQFNSRQQ